MLQKEEINRYQRQIILQELGISGQERLKAAKVLIVGAGGLGCPVLQYLAGAGVGCIGIVDDDLVSETNLHRQILYSAADIGQNKALAAKYKLNAFNPFVKVAAYPFRLTADNIDELFHKYDLILDGSDNFPTRYLVNDGCIKWTKPLVFGSIYKFEGQVSVFNYRGGPNYRDLFPTPPAEGEVPNCSEIGVIGVLPGITGTFMANEVIKIICGIGETLSGRLLCIDALNTEITSFKFISSISETKEVDVQRQNATHQVMKNLQNGISMNELEELRKNYPSELYLVDVREAYEYEDYNIGGINIPLFQLIDRIDEIPADKKKIVFCCQTGNRSKQAIHLLKPLLVHAELFSLTDGISTN